MPRIPRAQQPGETFHVINRGNNRQRVFHADGDYRAFVNLLCKAKQRVPVKLFTFSVMPNHFHLQLQADTEGAMSSFMQWWLTSHVRRYHRHYRTSGHVWQGRYKSFPIQCDEHFLTVARYVLRNPVRAGLAAEPRTWPWTSLAFPELTDTWPVPAPTQFDEWTRQPLSEREIEDIRNSVNRQAPFGDESWRRQIAKENGLESTLRPRGRPRN